MRTAPTRRGPWPETCARAGCNHRLFHHGPTEPHRCQVIGCQCTEFDRGENPPAVLATSPNERKG